MNSVLQEIYSTIVPSAPYIIAAYALIWVALMVFVFLIYRRVKRAEQQMDVLEERVSEFAADDA